MSIHTLPLARPSAFSRIAARAGLGLRRVAGWVRAYRNRRDLQLLAHLDDRMLQDIGLSRSDLRDAAAQPIWCDPTNILVERVRERRRAARAVRVEDLFSQPEAAGDENVGYAIDAWSSRQFPPRSRYY